MSGENLQPQELENITDGLWQSLSCFKECTCRTSVELTNERRTNVELRDIEFYTANFGMYTVEDNEEFLYFGEREANPIFGNIDEATTQLMGNHDPSYEPSYRPSKEEIESVVKSVESGNTLKIKLSDLELKDMGLDHHFFEISTSDYDSLNDTQRAFAERVYGQGEDFIENMKMLNDAGITTTKIFVLGPEYVQKHAKDSAIVRASKLRPFENSSIFYAKVNNVCDDYALRGVPLTTQDDMRKLRDAYKLIIANPDLSASILNPETATGLSNVLTIYLKRAQEQ